MPLRLTLTSADALSVALATIRPALRVLPPGTEAVLDGGRFVIEGSVPGQVEVVVSHEPALGDTQPPLSVADETQPEPVEALVRRVVEEVPQPDPMETAAELADAFVVVAPELQPEAFQAAVAELVEVAIPEADEAALSLSSPSNEEPKQDTPSRLGRAGNPQHAPWTAEDDGRAAELWNQGLSARKIAEEIGRSEGAVVQRLVLIRERGVHLIPHGPGGSSAEGGQPYTPEEDATILAGRKAGRTYVEIGAEIGRSPDACRQRHGKLSSPEEAPAPRRNALVPGEAEEIARLACEGLTAAGIAERMGLTNRVVALSLSHSRKRAEAAQLRALVEAARAEAAAVAPVDTSTEPVAVPPEPVDGTHSISELVAPEPLVPEPEPLPAIRVMRGVAFRQPAPSPLAAVTEAIREVGRDAQAAQDAGWSIEDDLSLAYAFADGQPLNEIADLVGRDTAAVKARWAMLNPDRLKPAEIGPLLDALEARRDSIASPSVAAE